jgi:hypothetical protein
MLISNVSWQSLLRCLCTPSLTIFSCYMTAHIGSLLSPSFDSAFPRFSSNLASINPILNDSHPSSIPLPTSFLCWITSKRPHNWYSHSIRRGSECQWDHGILLRYHLHYLLLPSRERTIRGMDMVHLSRGAFSNLIALGVNFSDSDLLCRYLYMQCTKFTPPLSPPC